MQNFLTGTGAFTADGDLIGAYGDARVSYVDCADIAACAAVLLTTDPGDRERFVVTGPQGLTHAEVASGTLESVTSGVTDLTGPPATSFSEFLACEGHQLRRRQPTP